jgi:hypothetical protein
VFFGEITSKQPLSIGEGCVVSRFIPFIPSKRQVGIWLHNNQLVRSRTCRFRVLLADLKGEDAAGSQTRHLESALCDQQGISIMPVGETLDIADGEIDADALCQCHSLIARHNGDSLIFGEVMPAAPRFRLRIVGRYAQDAGRLGPYQVDWIELPKHFGPDIEGVLLSLTVLSVSPAVQNDQDRSTLINLLRPAATKLTRLLEAPGAPFENALQGVFWHALGLATSLLGEYTRSRRWLEVAVQAHRTALLIWRQDGAVFNWAIVQNNLGYALRLLAEQQEDGDYRKVLLEKSVNAFQEALRIYRAATAATTYQHQTETNLALAEALLAGEAVAAE